MTEAEWLTCADPTPMLEFLQGKVSDRKLRLFAVACCRRIQWLLPDSRCVNAIEVAQQYADAKATAEELQVVARSTDAAYNDFARETDGPDRLWAAHMIAAHVAGHCAAPFAQPAAELSALYAAGALAQATIDRDVIADDAEWDNLADRIRAEEGASQSLIIREIFGNPFHPVALDPSWLAWNNGTVRRMAQSIYEERRLPEGTLDYARLAILSDALLDAGCDNEELIAHCRSLGPHVLGCWAIDQILAKD